ncbi:MAG: arginine--tRNA ligase [Candidatus Hermodarchaeota archaeon]
MKIINKKTLAEYLGTYISEFSIEELQTLIEIPPSNINFSYAFPTYRLGKMKKKSPNVIAKELEKNFKLPDYLDKIESSGPYLNFRVASVSVLNNIFNLKKDYGKINEILDEKHLSPLRIVIEYPAPNTNKPLHLGHVRNMLLGNALSKILEYKGQLVFQVNLNNDRGIHICKSMLAYKKLGNNSQPKEIKSDHFVGKFYVKYTQMEEENDKIIDEAKELLYLWEQNDQETRNIWKKMNKWALDGFKQTYEKFGITFDKEYFESEFYMKGKEKILEGLKKAIFEKREDGAIIARLKEKFGLPDKVLLRSDGTSIYITQDIYLAYLKKQDFDYNESIYIVGNEQDLYFKQLFAVLELIGFKEPKYHLSYGMIYLPEGKMKSREGSVVDADDLVEEMNKLAYEEVTLRYGELPEKEKLRRSNVIGMAALKFFILKFNPKSDFVFNPKESISFEGETGPYIQYCYARIQSIINKSTTKIDLNINFKLLNHEKEINIIKHLNYFPEVINSTVNTYGIHLIPQYFLNLCQSFNSFYSSCQVISEDKGLEKARLLLIKCVQIVIKIGLNLMGIETLDEM